MSAEAGGGLIAAIIVLALAGQIIAAAISALIVGAVVAGAVAAAVAGARALNKGLRALHRRRMEEAIKKQENAAPKAVAAGSRSKGKIVIVRAQDSAGNVVKQNDGSLTERVAEQRRKALELYERRSEEIDRLSVSQQEERNRLVEQARKIDLRRNEQFEQLQRRAAEMGRQNAGQVKKNIDEIRRETENQMAEWKKSVTDQLQTRRSQIENRLRRLDSILERDQEAMRYVRELMIEADSLYNQLKTESDADNLIGGYLKTIDQLKKDCGDLEKKGQGQAALAVAVSYTQQIMETYHRLDMQRHRRQLIDEQLNLSSAALKAMLENGASISIEQAAKLPKDADFWAEGRLKPVMEKAEKLLAQAADKNTYNAGKVEELMMQINACTEEMEEIMYLSRQAYACSFLRTQLMAKAQKGFEAGGWKALDWGYEKKDCRRAIIMRFSKEGGAKADLLIAPVYNAAEQRFDIDVKVERRDGGVIDEQLRAAQLADLEKKLHAQGVPVSGMRCRKGTEGRNAIGPAVQNRFGRPENGDVQ